MAVPGSVFGSSFLFWVSIFILLFLVNSLATFFPCKYDCFVSFLSIHWDVSKPRNGLRQAFYTGSNKAACERDISTQWDSIFSALLPICWFLHSFHLLFMMLQLFSFMKLYGVIFTKAMFYFKISNV